LDLAPQVNSLNHVGVSRSQATPQTGLSREEGQRPYFSSGFSSIYRKKISSVIFMLIYRLHL